MDTTSADRRAARLAQALRENLNRRKAQARGRRTADGATPPDTEKPSDAHKADDHAPSGAAPRR